MPNWKGALEHAIQLLEPGGTIWIVDFCDQADYPKWFQWALKKWLALFHVKFEPALLELIEGMHGTTTASGRQISVSIEPVGRRYGYIAKINT